MAEKNELMTIKAFADASGRSQQAIYKQISTRLSAYLHEIDGQKFVERRALFEVFGIGEEVEQCNFNSTNRKKSPSDKTMELLEKTIQMLEDQLKAKDKEIERLTETIQTQAQNVNAAQALHAGTMQQLLPDGAPSETADEAVEFARDEDVQEPAPEPSEPQTAQERERLLTEYAAALDAWSALGWLKRKRTPKPVMPELPEEE